jgi:acetoin utilization deacetylase AcuC-like enzyme
LACALRAVAGEAGVPLGAVLEGGYELDALARSVVVTLSTFGAEGDVALPEVARHPLTEEALDRLRRWWPDV